MGNDKMTPEQRRKAEIKGLQDQISELKREREQKEMIREERAEIERLHRELHPSKLQRLARLAGKSEHAGEGVGKKLIKLGKELNKVRKEVKKQTKGSVFRVK